MIFFAYISFIVGVSLVGASQSYIEDDSSRRLSSSGGSSEIVRRGSNDALDEDLHISAALHHNGSPHAHGHSHDERGNQRHDHGNDVIEESLIISPSIGGSLVGKDSLLHGSAHGDHNRKKSHSDSASVYHSHASAGNQGGRSSEELEDSSDSLLHLASNGGDEELDATELVTKPLVEVKHPHAPNEHRSDTVVTRVNQQDLEEADREAQLEEVRRENAEVDAFENAGNEEGDDPPDDAKAKRRSTEGESEKVSIQVGEKADPLHDRLSELLAHLYGEGIDAFARDAQNDETQTMMIDCSTEAEDLDWEVNIVTTLCPFLREDGPCGQFRHPSYQMENANKFCSNECRPFVNAIIHALDHRGRLEVRSEATILRGVANGLLLQYAAACRIGTYFMPN